MIPKMIPKTFMIKENQKYPLLTAFAKSNVNNPKMESKINQIAKTNGSVTIPTFKLKKKYRPIKISITPITIGIYALYPVNSFTLLRAKISYTPLKIANIAKNITIVSKFPVGSWKDNNAVKTNKIPKIKEPQSIPFLFVSLIVSHFFLLYFFPHFYDTPKECRGQTLYNTCYFLV